VEGAGGRLEDRGMVSQAQVVVRPQHDPLLAFNDHHRVFRLGDGLEVRVEAGGLNLFGLGELPALLKERDLLEYLGIHRTSALGW
jgi:hypothetical protein